MVFVVLALGLAVALLRGGRLRPDLNLEVAWIAPIALSIQFLAYNWPGTLLGGTLMIGSYMAMAYCIYRNFHFEAIRFVLVGLILNMAVSAINGGRLPVDLAAAYQVGVDISAVTAGTDPRHIAISENTRLPFLGDVVPVAWPVKKVVSPGDLFIYLGIFLLIQDVMDRRISLVGTSES